jgi:hypothetical protein
VFEFGRDAKPTEEKKARFREGLDRFLAGLPAAHRYAVEIRTREYLDAGHVALLNSHGVAPVLNWWTHMPELLEQFDVPGSADASFYLARVLVAPGRAYEDAVKFFTPYDRTGGTPADVRDAARISRRRRPAKGVFPDREQPRQERALYDRRHRKMLDKGNYPSAPRAMEDFGGNSGCIAADHFRRQIRQLSAEADTSRHTGGARPGPP